MFQLIGSLIGYTVLAVLLVFPLHRIFRRAGLNPNFSFLVFFPWMGLFITTGILALADWPDIETKTEAAGVARD